MYFVPEGQYDRSLARGSLLLLVIFVVLGKRPPREPSRRVRYDRAQLNPEVFLVEDVCRVFKITPLQSSNRCAGLRESDRT